MWSMFPAGEPTQREMPGFYHRRQNNIKYLLNTQSRACSTERQLTQAISSENSSNDRRSRAGTVSAIGMCTAFECGRNAVTAQYTQPL